MAKGATVAIHRLYTTPEVSDRLREMGFCEKQKIKYYYGLRERQLRQAPADTLQAAGLSPKLAEAIYVKAVSLPLENRDC